MLTLMLAAQRGGGAVASFGDGTDGGGTDGDGVDGPRSAQMGGGPRGWRRHGRRRRRRAAVCADGGGAEFRQPDGVESRGGLRSSIW